MRKNITVSATLATVAACALLAVVAAASGGGAGVQNTNSSTTQGNMNGNTGTSSGSMKMKMTADQKFAMEAAMGGMAEVEMGRVAAQKGASAEVRQFGQQMVDDHTKANAELMQIAESKGMTLPTALDAKHQMMMQKMSALSAEKFDKEYVKMQVKDHKKMAALFQKEANSGMDAELKAFASRTLPTVQEHLQMAQRMHDKMSMRGGGMSNMNNNSGGMSGNMNSNASNMNSNMGNMNSNMNSNMNRNSNSNMGNMNSNKNSNMNSNMNSNVNSNPPA